MRKEVKKEPLIVGGCEVLNLKNGDWFINVGTCRHNNGLPNQSFSLCINANIETVKRLSDGKCFTSNMTHLKTKSGSTIWATHFWFNTSLNTISVSGYYTKVKNPYKDDTIRSSFSANICSITDLQ